MVLEELQVPYVMETTPLRAYLKPGEKKKQRLVPVIQLIDEVRGKAFQWGGGLWLFGLAVVRKIDSLAAKGVLLRALLPCTTLVVLCGLVPGEADGRSKALAINGFSKRP